MKAFSSKTRRLELSEDTEINTEELYDVQCKGIENSIEN